MKLLKRNLTRFDHCAYLGKQEALDEGRHTGRYEVAYGEPVRMYGNISMPSGYVQNQWFGIETDYSHILLLDNPDTGIHEADRILWKGEEYEVKAVKPSLNVLSVALKRVKKPMAG